MKKSTVAMLGVVAATLASPALAMSAPSTFQEAYQKGAEARVEFKVIDDLGFPVSGATVNVFFDMVDRGMGRRIIGDTDTNGVYVAEAKTMGVLEIKVSREGYYSSTDRLSFIDMGREHEVKGGRWQPWGMQKEIVLKPCKRRIPLIVETKISETICTNRWYAIDLEKKDYVTPDGNGKVADLRFMIEWDGRKPSNAPSTALHISFDGVRNGGYYAGKQLQSEFPYVYQANTNDSFVLKTIDYSHWYDGKPGYGAWRGDKLEEDKSLVVRLRSNVDDEGKLLSANYANITRIKYGAGWDGKCWVSFSYFFNQIPNDPNLEP